MNWPKFASLGAILIAIANLLFASAPLRAADAASDEKWVELFDGKTLNGWKGDLKYWRVEDGAITGETTKANPSKTGNFLVWAGGTVRNFELTCKARIIGGNSGIEYRAIDPANNFQLGGYQCDFGPGESHNGKLYEDPAKGKHGRAGLAYPGNKVVIHSEKDKQIIESFGDKQKLKKGIDEGKWIEIHMVVKGNHFIHKLDGETMIDATDEDAEHRTMGEGLLGLQIHGGKPDDGMKVQFKEIRLKVLKPDGEKTR